MRGIVGNGKENEIRPELVQRPADPAGVLRKEAVHHQGNAELRTAGFQEFRGFDRGLTGALPADDFIMMFRTAVKGNAEILITAIQVSPDGGFLIRTAQKGDAGGHAVVKVSNVFHRGCSADNGSNIRMIEGLIIHGKAGRDRQSSTQFIQPGDTPQSVWKRNAPPGTAVDIAVPAARIAAGNDQIKIDIHCELLYQVFRIGLPTCISRRQAGASPSSPQYSSISMIFPSDILRKETTWKETL